MQSFETITALRALLKDARRDGQSLGLVPTMGNLHAGHLALVEKARESCDIVVVSLFVNPTQFSPGEDLANYPRTLEQDKAKLEAAGVDALFAPGEREMYPRGYQATRVLAPPALSGLLCGASRPGHFDGVCTVVAKLFNITRPDLAFFGYKDFQQLLIIRRMVEDLHLAVEIVGVGVQRAASGLALSSRNGYLNESEMDRAAVLYRCLDKTRRAIGSGTPADFPALEEAAAGEIAAAGLDLEYFTVRNADTLMPAAPKDRALVILTAARLGKTRLIDNIHFAR